MRITPLDIQQQKFERAFRGLNAKAVQNYLELLATDLEAFVREHNELKERLRQQENQLFEFKEREIILKETLITAQKMSAEMKVNAQKESQVIIAQAEMQAEKIVNLAYQRLAKIVGEIQDLKRERARVESDLRAVLDSHLKILEATKTDSEESSLEDKLKFLHASNPK
jgi:cell division initiation protein